MCCRKNRIAYAAPAGRAAIFDPTPYGCDTFQNRRGCCGGRRRRRGGLIAMIVRAIIERHEAKQAQRVVSGQDAIEDPERPLPQVPSLYGAEYQHAAKEYEKGVKSEEKEEEEDGRRVSFDSGLGEWTPVSVPPPSYEMVERSEKGL
ncbi:hypothetical protein SCAR479_06053 [Seiridium cardinale]|uniref:Uncharacterized protein n=1 Tax=Seiridium cardinale TaxID=138064 RepID=A0ABR2XUI4_9PEZI